MKKLLLSLLFISLVVSPAFCRVKVIYEQDDIASPAEEIVAQETDENNEVLTEDEEQIQEPPENEAKIINDNAVYFDIDKYEKNRLTGKIFQLQIEQNEELLKYKQDGEYINITTDYTTTNVGREKFNNKTTISSKTMTNSGLLFPNLSVGYGAEIKEYMPLPDTTNYSTISTSLYADYKLKYLTFEGELEHTNNVAQEAMINYISFGPKINITKSTAIKSSITKEFNSDNIYGEVAFIYKPLKTKRDVYFEINAWSSNAQYNVSQQRLQVFGKIKI